VKHTLGGRTFEVIGESTVEHDFTFMGIARKVGLDRPALLDNESVEEFAVRLLGDLLASGLALDLLGCLLIPEGIRSEDWTPEIGQETANFLGRLSSPAEKDKVRSLTLAALVDFFESGLAFSIASETSSGTSPREAKPGSMQIDRSASEAGRI